MLIDQTFTPLFNFKLREGSLQMVILQNKRGQYGIIENVFVEEEFRGRGIATKLVKKAIDTARKFGLYKITLTCSEDLTSMYTKMGFKWYSSGQSHCMRINLK